MKQKIYLHRDKEENYDLVKKAKKNGIQNADNLLYTGYEIELEVEISKDGVVNVLKINNTDISDKGVKI